MNKDRPVNLDISTISFPIPAIVSIIHRISGMVMLAGVLVLLFMLDMSLGSEKSYDELREYLAAPWAKIVVWIVLAALAYHAVAGIRHLIMDIGVGESLEGGRLGAKLVVFLSVLLIIAAGVWIW